MDFTILLISNDKDLSETINKSIPPKMNIKFIYINGTFKFIFNILEEVKPQLIMISEDSVKEGGIDICLEIRKNSNIPILIIYEKYNDFLFLDSYRAGVDLLVEKNNIPNDIASIISKYVNDVYKAGILNNEERLKLCISNILSQTPIEQKKIDRSKLHFEYSAIILTFLHSLNTYFSIMRGQLFIIQDVLFNNQKNEFSELLNKRSDNLLKSIESAIKLSLEFRAIFSTENIEKGKTDLIEIISYTIIRFKDRFLHENKNVEIDFINSNPGVNAYISGYPQAVEKALDEIIYNSTKAIKFSKKERGLITITLEDYGSDYRIAVRDNATGMPEEVISHIFLERVSSNSGTGVGLMIVKALVETLGGYIYLKSSDKTGTCIVIGFPKIQTNMLEENEYQYTSS